MNKAKMKLIDNIMTMPDDFSEEAIVLQLLLKESPAPYRTRPQGRMSLPKCHNRETG